MTKHGSATVRASRKAHSVKKSKLPSVDTKKCPDLNEIEKWNIIAWCMQYFDGEKMAYNTYTAAAQFFNGRVAANTIKWSRTVASQPNCMNICVTPF